MEKDCINITDYQAYVKKYYLTKEITKVLRMSMLHQFMRITAIRSGLQQKVMVSAILTGQQEKLPDMYPGKDVDFAIYCAMLQDGRGNLWITSTRGLLRLDPSSSKFITYTKDDGLLDNTFSYNSAYQDKNGKMYFGTVSGTDILFSF